MHIRPATDQDIPSIVQLLKLSLGESLMPKSEEFWRWKHINNPFGPSPVLLAFEQDQLIGVRGFMRWEWKQDEKIYKAVRAVDTATHPLHQGKGIFRTLTMQLVEQCQVEGVNFIFNTPNKISRPGYINMGWQETGRLPLSIKLHVFKKSWKGGAVNDSWDALDHHPWMKQKLPGSSITTKISREYFHWRYRDNPNAKYHILSAMGERPFILIYRMKESKRIMEVRITELLCHQEYVGYAVRCLQSRVSGMKMITLSTSMDSVVSQGFITWPMGPIVTTRNLNMSAYPESLSFGKWSPSLGDLELF